MHGQDLVDDYSYAVVSFVALWIPNDFGYELVHTFQGDSSLIRSIVDSSKHGRWLTPLVHLIRGAWTTCRFVVVVD
jgi:hypothetical protein